MISPFFGIHPNVQKSPSVLFLRMHTVQTGLLWQQIGKGSEKKSVSPHLYEFYKIRSSGSGCVGDSWLKRK